MKIYNIHEAKTHMSRLVDLACAGDSFMIAKAGLPKVKVIAADSPSSKKRIGFLKGQISIPNDFEYMEQKQIENLFGTNL